MAQTIDLVNWVQTLTGNVCAHSALMPLRKEKIYFSFKLLVNTWRVRAHWTCIIFHLWCQTSTMVSKNSLTNETEAILLDGPQSMKEETQQYKLWKIYSFVNFLSAEYKTWFYSCQNFKILDQEMFSPNFRVSDQETIFIKLENTLISLHVKLIFLLSSFS